MQFSQWSDSLNGDGLVFGTKMESQRAGNHTAIYFAVRRGNKPVRFFTPLTKCKFAPNEEYNSVDVSVYAPANGNQGQMDSFVEQVRVTEEHVIQWVLANASTIFEDFDPVPDEALIRSKFKSCVVERTESIKFRMVPELGSSFFDKDGHPIDKVAVRQLCSLRNLPNMRIACEIKSVGVYNPSKRKQAKIPFDGKIELRLFALQVRVLPPDDRDSTDIQEDVCMMPAEDDL